MAEDRPDLILTLGDYIYEDSWGEQLVRRFEPFEAFSLEDYRRRYTQYRLDPDLQAAHAACPWLVTWDDHEVDNDYVGLTGENELCGGDACGAFPRAAPRPTSPVRAHAGAALAGAGHGGGSTAAWAGAGRPPTYSARRIARAGLPECADSRR